MKLRTHVSSAYWCNVDGTFEPALWAKPGGTTQATEGPSAICWLDHQLEGGIALPKDLLDRSVTAKANPAGSRGLSILVSGPPGSGKSVLAMELCYRWSLSTQLPDRPNGLFCFYVATESPWQRLLEKAESFGWNQPPANTRFIEYGRDRIQGWGHVCVLGQDKLGHSSSPAETINELIAHWSERLAEQFPTIRHPDVLVIDSLNLIHRTDQQVQAYLDFAAACTNGPLLTVFVVESATGFETNRVWEHACDLHIKMERKYSPYMLRTIEVVKARNQAHVWGPQLLKIYPKGPDSGGAVSHATLTQARRQHPFRSEGGIFIYPVIHYYLSVYKRQMPSTVPIPAETPLPSLNASIDKGFPSGRCTAFIGIRGGHKSHLAYYHLLWRVVKKREKALIVSLRDDEGMARQTMSKILRQQFSRAELLQHLAPNYAWHPAQKSGEEDYAFEEECIRRLEMRGDVEILYYPPGYISPEEFFHRVFITIRQMKRRGDEQITALFNSLDQLSARFPLCANESIFVPGLIDMLTAENITCIFVAAKERGQPPEQYGLLPMADLILSFAHERVPGKNHVVVTIERIPGGRAAGAKGILELISDSDGDHKAGLYFRAIDEHSGGPERVAPIPT